MLDPLKPSPARREANPSRSALEVGGVIGPSSNEEIDDDSVSDGEEDKLGSRRCDRNLTRRDGAGDTPEGGAEAAGAGEEGGEDANL